MKKCVTELADTVNLLVLQLNILTELCIFKTYELTCNPIFLIMWTTLIIKYRLLQ